MLPIDVLIGMLVSHDLDEFNYEVYNEKNDRVFEIINHKASGLFLKPYFYLSR